MLTIGQLAAMTGVPTSTIRFWERKGLLPPARRERGQRRYSADDRSAIGMLMVCQDAGFTLAEIRQMLRERADKPTGWREFVQAKMAHIEDRISRLDHARKLLTHAIDCPLDDITRCPLFRAAIDRRVSGEPGVPSELATQSGRPTTAACPC